MTKEFTSTRISVERGNLSSLFPAGLSIIPPSKSRLMKYLRATVMSCTIPAGMVDPHPLSTAIRMSSTGAT